MPESYFARPFGSLPVFAGRGFRGGGETILSVVVALFLCFCLPSGLEASGGRPKAAQWRIQVVGLAAQSYIWVEHTIFDDAWHGDAGSGSDGYGSPPSLPSAAVIGPKPLPRKIFARWFHVGQQRFYEAVIDDPALPDKIAAIAAEKSARGEYKLSLITAISDNGVFELWLDGYNPKLPKSLRRYAELVATARAREAPGEPERYARATKKAREEGRIPAEPLPPPPGVILLPKE